MTDETAERLMGVRFSYNGSFSVSSGVEVSRARTVGAIARRKWPVWLVVLVGSVAVGCASSVAALWFYFAVLASQLKLGRLLTGFAVGITAGVLSMIPGGLGVQEGSMAGIYALLGLPLQQAVLAAILYRAVDYLIPYVVSLGFYWHLVRWVGRGQPKANDIESA